MFKKNGLKKCIISTLAIIFGLSVLSTNVMAVTIPTTDSTYTAVTADTKEVTATVTQSTPNSIPGGEIGAFFDSLSQTTYEYDDGSYQGTLYFSKFPNWKILRAAGQDCYFVITDVEYTGTVTNY